MVDAHPGTSCRRLFKKLEILTLPIQYIYSLTSFFTGGQEKILDLTLWRTRFGKDYEPVVRRAKYYITHNVNKITISTSNNKFT